MLVHGTEGRARAVGEILLRPRRAWGGGEPQGAAKGVGGTGERRGWPWGQAAFLALRRDSWNYFTVP